MFEGVVHQWKENSSDKPNSSTRTKKSFAEIYQALGLASYLHDMSPKLSQDSSSWHFGWVTAWGSPPAPAGPQHWSICPRHSSGAGGGCNPVVPSKNSCLPAGCLSSSPCWGEGVGILWVSALLWVLEVHAVSRSLTEWRGVAVWLSCVQNNFIFCDWRN